MVHISRTCDGPRTKDPGRTKNQGPKHQGLVFSRPVSEAASGFSVLVDQITDDVDDRERDGDSGADDDGELHE